MNAHKRAYFSVVVYTIIWGAGFPLMKQALDFVDPMSLLALRFSVGAATLFLISLPKYKMLSWDLVKKGGILGILLYGTMILQTFGMNETSASNAAFISSVYVVLVPIYVSIRSKMKVRRNNQYALVFTMLGLFCVSGMIGWTSAGPALYVSAFNRGDFLMLLSSFGFVAYILMSNTYARDSDPSLLTMLNMLTVAVLADIVLFGLNVGQPIKMDVWHGRMLVTLVVIGVFGAAICYWGMIRAQRSIGPVALVLILSVQPAFSMLFATLIPNKFGMVEIPSVMEIIGCVFILSAVLISEFGGLYNTRSFQLRGEWAHKRWKWARKITLWREVRKSLKK